MLVKRYTDSLKKTWDEFIPLAKNATFLFHRAYMEYHSNRFQDYSLVIYKKNKIIALFPSNIKNEVVYSHQGISYGGIITSDKTSFQETVLIYIAILEYYQQHNISTVQIKLFPSFYTDTPSDEANYLMHLLRAKKTRCDVTLAIKQNCKTEFSTNKKRNIKLANKSNLRIEESTDFTSFWNEILIPNMKDNHKLKPVHTAKEISLLQSSFKKEIKLYIVTKDNIIIAGTVIYLSKQVAHAQYIAANKTGKNTAALDLLFDYLINEKHKQKQYFDFGIVNQNEGINLGLTYWKEGFGARTHTHDFYEIKTTNTIYLKKIIE
jgi:hypothetical protein